MYFVCNAVCILMTLSEMSSEPNALFWNAINHQMPFSEMSSEPNAFFWNAIINEMPHSDRSLMDPNVIS